MLGFPDLPDDLETRLRRLVLDDDGTEGWRDELERLEAVRPDLGDRLRAYARALVALRAIDADVARARPAGARTPPPEADADPAVAGLTDSTPQDAATRDVSGLADAPEPAPAVDPTPRAAATRSTPSGPEPAEALDDVVRELQLDDALAGSAEADRHATAPAPPIEGSSRADAPRAVPPADDPTPPQPTAPDVEAPEVEAPVDAPLPIEPARVELEGSAAPEPAGPGDVVEPLEPVGSVPPPSALPPEPRRGFGTWALLVALGLGFAAGLGLGLGANDAAAASDDSQAPSPGNDDVRDPQPPAEAPAEDAEDDRAWNARIRAATTDPAFVRPARPRHADALAAWLTEHGEPLALELARRRATADALHALRRTAAIGPRPAEESRAPQRHLTREIDWRRWLLTSLETRGDGENAALRRRLEREIATLTRQLDPTAAGGEDAPPPPRDVPPHAGDVDADLAAFVDGPVARVRSDLEWARTVTARSIDAHREAWDRAAACVRAGDGATAHRAYAGLELSPQLGLVPLGMDRDTKLWEFYHLRSDREPSLDLPSRDPTTGRLLGWNGRRGIVFVLLPANPAVRIGETGSDTTPLSRDFPREDTHAHTVELAAVFVAKHELTQAQWQALATGTNPSRYAAGGALGAVSLDHPVESVSWLEANATLARHELALPTEAQWEYAAGAGTATAWSCGDDAARLDAFANLADRAAIDRAGWPGDAFLADGHVVHAPVGSFGPNAFGLFDVHGNVAEWCRDARVGYDVTARPGDGLRRDPNPPSVGPRVVRGGGFDSPARAARTAARDARTATTADAAVGLRPVRAIQP